MSKMLIARAIFRDTVLLFGHMKVHKNPTIYNTMRWFAGIISSKPAYYIVDSRISKSNTHLTLLLDGVAEDDPILLS